MSKKLHLLMTLILLSFAFVTTAQENLPIIYEQTAVYNGPGDTYPILTTMNPGIAVEVVERNRIGNWLRIKHEDNGDGLGEIDGWVLTGYLTLPDSFKMSDLSISDLPDAVTDGIPDPDIVRLYDTSIIPRLSDAMFDVYEHGLEMGNQPDVVAKVGDSNSTNGRYLKPIASGAYNLGPYDYLQDVIDTYGPSFGNVNIAARIGLNAYSVFDPLWSNATYCEADETPLHCEYRHNQPSIAVILFGQNDTRVLSSEQFETQMRLVVEQSLDMGVIPLLVSFSSNDGDDYRDLYLQAIRFNVTLLDIAEEYEVPLLNFWSAARILPGRGVGDDDAHLTGGADSVNFLGTESRQGVPLLNLTVLAALNEIHRELDD